MNLLVSECALLGGANRFASGFWLPVAVHLPMIDLSHHTLMDDRMECALFALFAQILEILKF
jgi:hypothetical protein